MGTIFITARGTVGKTVLASRNMAMSQSCYAICGKEVPNVWVFYALRNSIEELKKKSHGAVFDTIIMETFTHLLIVKPPTPLMEMFVQTVRPCLSLILNCSKKQEVLRKTRDLLLPKLISGQLDVEHIDIDVGEPVTA
jgi:type I restriction enzyme, S subunit